MGVGDSNKGKISRNNDIDFFFWMLPEIWDEILISRNYGSDTPHYMGVGGRTLCIIGICQFCGFRIHHGHSETPG